MTIEINKGGFGIASLFTKDSTKEVLTEQTGMNGDFLEELGIKFKVGDEISLRTPAKFSGFYIHKIKVYSIVGEVYNCEFI